MVSDILLPEGPEVSWCDHKLFKPTEVERVSDVDPEKVLKNVSAQTGLIFKKEKRKVQVLVIAPDATE
jgi:hypothetical protein